MKKVLLLSTNQAVTPYPVAPIGPALLYQVLKTDYTVVLIDGFSVTAEELCDRIARFQPDYIGVSIRNIDDMVKGAVHSFIPHIHETFIKTIRRCSQAVLILGGAGFTLFPQELLELLEADYGIAGEAEKALPLLLKALDLGKDPLLIGGVIARGHMSVKRHPVDFLLEQPVHADLDTLLDYSVYRERSAYPIQTKRGCCHRCIYCSYPLIEGKLFRKRTISHVVDEIEAASARIADPGLVFEFVDSTFNDPPGHAEAICREIIRRHLRVTLRTMGMNPVNINEELLRLMKEAGFTQIDATPDAACTAMLKGYGKNFSMDDLKRAAELLQKFEMPTMWFFIFGGPGETEKTIRRSFAFIDRYIYENDMVHITEGLRIYPLTPLALQAKKEGIISKEDSLLFPVFYVSPLLGDAGLTAIITREIAHRPNCIRLTDTRPPRELMERALRERAALKLNEPMFRTLLRLKRELQDSATGVPQP